MLVFISSSKDYETRYRNDSYGYLRHLAEIYPELLSVEDQLEKELGRKLWASESVRTIEEGERRITREKLQRVFSESRTVGYPVLLVFIHMLSPGLGLLPEIQYALLALAVFFLYTSLCVYGFRKPAAFFGSSILLYAGFVSSFVPEVMSDSAGVSMAIVTVGFLFRAAGKPGRLFPLLGMGLSAFFTYQIRPAFLFLVPWLPLSVLALEWIRGRYEAVKPGTGQLIRHIAVAILLALFPLLLFSAARMSLTGHFGLTSFGGINFIGITLQLLPEDRVDELPEHLRGPASEMLACMKERRPLLETGDEGLGRNEYRKLFRRYNYTIHQCAVKVARELSKAENGVVDKVYINNMLQELSTEIFTMRPGLYLDVVYNSFIIGLKNTFRSGRLMNGALAMILAGLLAGGFAAAGALKMHGLTGPAVSPRARLEIYSLLFVATSFYTTKLLLVILVEMPIPRYMLAAGAFLPALLAGAAASIWTDVFSVESS